MELRDPARHGGDEIVPGPALCCRFRGSPTRAWPADVTRQNWLSLGPVETILTSVLSRVKAT